MTGKRIIRTAFTAAMLFVLTAFPLSVHAEDGVTGTLTPEEIMKDLFEEKGLWDGSVPDFPETPEEGGSGTAAVDNVPEEVKAAIGDGTEATGSITVETSADPAPAATISWHSDLSADEFRYLPGTRSGSDFKSAIPAGSGTEGSVSVSENGNYTVFARYGSSIVTHTLTVASIDRHSPDITLCSAVRNEDGSINVYYTVRDYYDGNVEVRIIEGARGIGSFESARRVSGSPVTKIPAGVYTLFAKDSAGNISSYTLTATESASSGEFHDSETETESGEWETEWHSSDALASLVTAAARIRKVDSATGADIPDAKLQLIDKETGLIRDEWVSNGSVHEVDGLIPGRTYILHETCYPKGYRKAADIEFSPAAGETAVIIMEDDPQTQIETPPETTPGRTEPQTTPPETTPKRREYVPETEPKRGYEAETAPPETAPSVPPEPVREKVGTITGQPVQDRSTGMTRLPQTGGDDAVVAFAVLSVLFGAAGAVTVKKIGKKETRKNKEKTGDNGKI